MVKTIQISPKPELSKTWTNIIPLLEFLCTAQHYKVICTHVCLLGFSPHPMDCALPMSTEYQAQSPHPCQTNEQKVHTNIPCKIIKPNINISILEVRTQMHRKVAPEVGSGGRPCLLIPRTDIAKSSWEEPDSTLEGKWSFGVKTTPLPTHVSASRTVPGLK